MRGNRGEIIAGVDHVGMKGMMMMSSGQVFHGTGSCDL